jgi:hypothetical protein
MTDLLTNPLLPGYLFAGFVLAGAVVVIALWIQRSQDMEGGSL